MRFLLPMIFAAVAVAIWSAVATKLMDGRNCAWGSTGGAGVAMCR